MVFVMSPIVLPFVHFPNKILSIEIDAPEYKNLPCLRVVLGESPMRIESVFEVSHIGFSMSFKRLPSKVRWRILEQFPQLLEIEGLHLTKKQQALKAYHRL